jgi:DNA-binding NarL/FixJ family response regulator
MLAERIVGTTVMSLPNAIRVVTACRADARQALSREPELRVVGELQDARALAGLVQRQQPSVAVIDASMISEIARIRAASAGTRVVVILESGDDQSVNRAFAAGATAVVGGSAVVRDLGMVVRAAARGSSMLVMGGPEEINHVLRPTTADPGTAVASLSDREREVLSFIARGHTNKQAADQIGVSVKTVESYRARIMQKLQLTGRAELTSLALRAGIMQTKAE